MASTKKTPLTSVQKKALKGAAAQLDQAYADARKRLSAAGISPNEGSTRCLAAPAGHCRSFKPPRFGIRCARSGCGHPLSRHDVF